MNRLAITNCLVGGALGDALGLPAEGMLAKRIAKRWRGPLKHRFLLGSGMVSDDTEHAVMTVGCLADHPDPDSFSRDLARKLRWWFAGVPAGIGLATARSIIRLWLGVDPKRSGVWSAGNGPLMRAPIIGVWYDHDDRMRKAFVEASTLITHKDPRALEAAWIVAEVASWASTGSADREVVFARMNAIMSGDEMRLRLPLMRDCLARSASVSEFADSFGRRVGFVSGFAPDTAAVAIYAWLRHRGDFREIITSVVLAGGDTDTVAFVAGSLAGIDPLSNRFPSEWICGLKDYPINPDSLAGLPGETPFRFPNWPVSLVRNALFLVIVLIHGFRRIFPPY